MNRVFFALDINANDKQNLIEWRDYNPLPFKPVPQSNLHLTLAFIGSINDEELALLRQKTQLLWENYPCKNKISIHLDHVGHFPNAKVLYIGNHSIPNQLARLVTSLNQLLTESNLTFQQQTYRPHITLYRKANHYMSVPSPNKKLTFSSFSLYQSIGDQEGVKYIPLTTFKFN